MTIVARSGAWLAFLAVALVRLHDLEPPRTTGALSGLPSGPDAAAGVVMALARMAAIGLGWYLVAATALTLASAALEADRRSPRPRRRLVPRAVDDLLRGVCGLTLALSTSAAPAMASAAPESPITMRRLHRAADAPDEQAPITMRRLEPLASADPVVADPPPGRHVIAAGEHLWSVAESVLTTAWSTPPTDTQIDPYWRALIHLNRSRLPDPANPDYIRPGDVLELPPVPHAAG